MRNYLAQRWQAMTPAGKAAACTTLVLLVLAFVCGGCCGMSIETLAAVMFA